MFRKIKELVDSILYKQVGFMCVDKAEYDELSRWLSTACIKNVNETILYDAFDEPVWVITAFLSPIDRLLYKTEFIETEKETWGRFYVPRFEWVV